MAYLLRCFNPRARDGREQDRKFDLMLQISFNPRARDGREVRFNNAVIVHKVSIHAPVMDANITIK